MSTISKLGKGGQASPSLMRTGDAVRIAIE